MSNGYGMAASGANAMAEFYQGYQRGRQMREQKQRQAQMFQMLQQQMQTGQVRPEAKMATGGEMSYTFPFVEQEQPYQVQQGVQVPEGYQITEYDYQGQPKIKRIGADSTKRLREEKATEELGRRKAVRQPLDTRIPQPKKGGWLGIGKTTVGEATTSFSKTIKTRQDLINMVKNADSLEGQGVDISQIEELYEDELLKLAQEGYLSEKK